MPLALALFGRQRSISSTQQESEAALSKRVRSEALAAELGRRALRSNDFGVLLSDTVRLVAQTCEMDFCMVLEQSLESESLLLRAGTGWKPGVVGQAVITGGVQSRAGSTLLTNSPLVVEDLRTESRFTGASFLHTHGVTSGVSVIIPRQDRAFSVLGVYCTRQHHFTPEDIHCLQAVAQVLALALDRIQAEESARQLLREQIVQENTEMAQDRLSFLSGVSFALAASLTYDATAEKLSHLAIPFLADWCSVTLLNGDDVMRAFPIAYVHSTKAETVAQLQKVCDALPHSYSWEQVVRSGQAQLLSIFPEAQPAGSPVGTLQDTFLQVLGECSLMIVPLLVRKQILGMMTLIVAESGRRYLTTDLVLAESLAQRCALALDTAHLYEEAQKALHDYEEASTMLDTLLTTAPVGMAFFDDNSRYVRVNSAMAAINGLPIEAHLGRTPYELLPELAPTLEPIHRQVLETAEPVVNVEISGVTPATPNHRRHWLVNYYPVRIPQKPLLGLGVVVVDITERRQMEEHLQTSLKEKEVLLREIHHRVKNNLQIVSSLLDLQADTLEDPRVRVIFEESQLRIQAMALIHESLYQSDDLARIDAAQYFSRLCASLSQAYSTVSERVTLAVQAEAVWLEVQTAIACGLILQELLSNGFKHAFPDGRKGSMSVTLQVVTGQQALLEVQDTGVGFPAEVNFQHTDSLGLQLVCLLTEQLRGNLTLERQGGTHWQLTFPLEVA